MPTFDRFLLAGRTNRLPLLLAVVALGPFCCAGQQPDAGESQAPSKHVFWIIPNFRTSPTLKEYKPVSTKEKFNIATQDTFDRGTVALAAAFAGQGQLTNSNRSFGQGVDGYAHYFATSYADLTIGNYMTEGIYPTFLHQDPRYFRRGSGTKWSRLGHAVGQIFWTHSDSGAGQFNYSEILGNSTAVAISQAYYPENRNVSDALIKLATQLGVDATSNIMKEFWPGRDKPAKKHSKN
jgi:hypothetical protein